jgi:hypothetical protein
MQVEGLSAYARLRASKVPVSEHLNAFAILFNTTLFARA